jgi:hypothetical protein
MSNSKRTGCASEKRCGALQGYSGGQFVGWDEGSFLDPGLQYLCVVSTGFLEILDPYIDVTELQFHCMPPAAPASY